MTNPLIKSVLITSTLLGLANPSLAQPQIWLDGYFSDWDQLSEIYTDAENDQQSGDLDFGRLWAANDADNLYLRFELGTDINLQSGNGVILYLDTDNNATTGVQIHGLGAELIWTFGDRDGSFKGSNIYHEDIGLITMPTYSSTVFEVNLSRHSVPNGIGPLFEATSLRIMLRDSNGGDYLPSESGGVLYNFWQELPAPVTELSLQRHPTADIRIMNHNVHFDDLFDASLRGHFLRMYQAVDPEIIGLQEIYDHNAEETAALIETILPSENDEYWFSAKAGNDNIVVSRYPILETFEIPGWYGNNDANGAFLLDLYDEFGEELLFIVAHTPCCDEDEGRQYDVDAIMGFVRDAKTPGTEFNLAESAPIVITGDMNMVGDSQQLWTLLHGEILDQEEFGPSFSPDWDGSSFVDLVPRATNAPFYFTWYSEYSDFSPGRLDFFIFSDSVLEALRQYVLFTPAMSFDSLNASGLLEDDAVLASDHLPMVADFRFNATSQIVAPHHSPTAFKLGYNYPNPFNTSTVIRWHLQKSSDVRLTVYDLSSREVRDLANGFIAGGHHQIEWDGTNSSGELVASGVYLYKLTVNGSEQARKMVLLK